MLEDGVCARDAVDRLRVLDVAEIVEAATRTGDSGHDAAHAKASTPEVGA
jgi:hypothetical protein